VFAGNLILTALQRTHSQQACFRIKGRLTAYMSRLLCELQTHTNILTVPGTIVSESEYASFSLVKRCQGV
jgi:hypothetical protein